MKRKKRWVAGGWLLAAVTAAVAAAGCGSLSTNKAASGATGASTNAGGSSPTVSADLLPPAGAPVFTAKPSAPVTAPTSGQPMSLPYSYIFPLPAGPIGDPHKRYTFCMSQALTGSTWAVAQADSVRVEAARHPNVKVLYYNTNNDPLKQIQDLETCAAQKVNGILVWPHSVAPLTPEIQKLHNEGFVVVGMERTVATRDYSTWIYLNNPQATGDLAKAVCDKLGGKGTVVETDGALGSSPQILRRVGFVDGLKKYCPAVKVDFTEPTDYSRGQGYQVALNYLQAHQNDKIGAWYTQYTEIGYGVAQALKNYKRTNIPQFSIVDGKTAVHGVLNRTFYAIAPWSPLEGDVALRAAIYHILGKPVPKAIVLSQPPLITRANAAQALRTNWPG